MASLNLHKTTGDTFSAEEFNLICDTIDGKVEMLGGHPVEAHTEASLSIRPNVMYRWGVMPSLNLTLQDPIDTNVVNEYMFEFSSGDAPTQLTLPSTVKWTKPLVIVAKKTYQVSILNNIAVIVGV